MLEKIKENFNENKPAWIVGAMLLVLIIIGINMPAKDNNQNLASEREVCGPGFAYNEETGEKCPEETKKLVPEDCNPGDKFSPSTGAPCSDEVKKENVSAPSGGSGSKKSSSLFEALAEYKGYTFAVGADCSLTPNSQTVPVGTRIMVHNEGTTVRTVTVGGTPLTLKPYYYRTVSLVTAGDVDVKCDGQQVGMISVR